MTEMLPFHPLAEAFPLLPESERPALAEDIKTHGVRVPGTLYEGAILDGRNRYLASKLAGVDMPFEEYQGDDPIAFVISANLQRRHLDTSQRAMVAAKLANMRQGERTDLQPSGNLPKVAQPVAAKMLKVGERSVRHATAVLEQAVPALAAAVEAGTVKVSAAAIIAGELLESEQVEIVARGPKELQKAASALRKRKHEKNKARRTSKVIASATAPEFPIGRRYPVIYVDPPWRYENPHMGTSNRSIENHYDTMSIDDICALPIRELATPAAVLFLWIPVPHLFCSGSKVLEAWGFTYRSMIVWDKEVMGCGYWTRGQHELLLLCSRGGFPPPEGTNCPRSLYRERRGEHSAKPHYFYDMIEKMFPQFHARPPASPLMIELFANVRPEDAREGWAVWGKPHRV
jgi:N6-adenosine-specific RNA methylase IME4